MNQRFLKNLVLGAVLFRSALGADAIPNITIQFDPNFWRRLCRLTAGAILALVPGLFSESRFASVTLADAASQPGKNTQIVLVYNSGGIAQEGLLSQAEVEAGALFKSAQVELQWRDGSPADVEGHTLDYTPSGAAPEGHGHLGIGALRLLISEHAPAGLAGSTLGFALPCTRSGVNAVIYLDSARQLAAEWRIALPAALGYVIAHELGHVLLRSSRHNSHGLMRERWGKRDWIDRHGDLLFTGEENRTMWNEVRRRNAASSMTEPAEVARGTPHQSSAREK